MPKLSEGIVKEIREILKSEQYKNCTQIAEYISSKYNVKITRHLVSDINIGQSHKDENTTYPISKKYARNYLTVCCICGEKARASVNGKEYCRKHYMQIYHHGEILQETIYDPNELIDHGDYVEIILKNQFFEKVGSALVDKEDWDKVKQYKWYCHQYDSGKKYCQGTLKNGEKVRLHHFILGISKNTLKGKVVDHINGNSLDNRKSNLRIVSQKENMLNMKPNDAMKGIRVHYLKDGTPRYGARISYNYKTISLGTFDTLEQAQKARKEAEEKIKSQK